MRARRPITHALIVLGYTLTIIVIVFIVGGIATATIFGNSDEAHWGFTLLFFMLFAPIALLTGLTRAIIRFVKERRSQGIRDETARNGPNKPAQGNALET
jgi:O-antigen/teichoic acid export membrane protein